MSTPILVPLHVPSTDAAIQNGLQVGEFGPIVSSSGAKRFLSLLCKTRQCELSHFPFHPVLPIVEAPRARDANSTLISNGSYIPTAPPQLNPDSQRPLYSVAEIDCSEGIYLWRAARLNVQRLHLLHHSGRSRSRGPEAGGAVATRDTGGRGERRGGIVCGGVAPAAVRPGGGRVDGHFAADACSGHV